MRSASALRLVRGGRRREGLPFAAGVVVDPGRIDAAFEVRAGGEPLPVGLSVLAHHPDGRAGVLLVEGREPPGDDLELVELDAGAPPRVAATGPAGAPLAETLAVEVLRPDGIWLRRDLAAVGEVRRPRGRVVHLRAELELGEASLAAEAHLSELDDAPATARLELELASVGAAPAPARVVQLRVRGPRAARASVACAAVPVLRGSKGTTLGLDEAVRYGPDVELAPGEVRAWRVLLGTESLEPATWSAARDAHASPTALFAEPRATATSGFLGPMDARSTLRLPDPAESAHAARRRDREADEDSPGAADPPVSELALRFAQSGHAGLLDALRDDALRAAGAAPREHPAGSAELWTHLATGSPAELRRATHALRASARAALDGPLDPRALGRGLGAVTRLDALPGGDARALAGELVARALDASYEVDGARWLGGVADPGARRAPRRLVYPAHLAAVVFGLDAVRARAMLAEAAHAEATALQFDLCDTLAGPCQVPGQGHAAYRVSPDDPQHHWHVGPRGEVEAVPGALALGWVRSAGPRAEAWLGAARGHERRLGHPVSYLEAGAAWPFWQPFVVARRLGFEREGDLGGPRD